MSKRGLPTNLSMRHDSHYVDELTRANRTIGRIIPIKSIEPNPDQPRVEIGDLTELTDSIKEKGVLEPLLVKPMRETGTWLIIAGERRWRAATLAGLREVPCIELDIDEKSIAEIALIENLQRKDLTLWEEADGLKSLSERFNYTHDEIAKKISKSRSTVTELLTIASLPDKVRAKTVQAKINSKSTLLEIARQFDEEAMLELLDNIQNKNLKRDDIRQTVRPQAAKPISPPPASAPETFRPSVQNVQTNAQTKQPENVYTERITATKSYSDTSNANDVSSNGRKDTVVNLKTDRDDRTDKVDNTFRYVSPDDEYTVEIKFNNSDKYTGRDIQDILMKIVKSIPH